MSEGQKVGFSKSVSLGNLLTIVSMLAGVAGIWVRIEVSDARQDERLANIARRTTDNERRVGSLELRREEGITAFRAELSQINSRLARIEGYLQHSTPSRPTNP